MPIFSSTVAAPRGAAAASINVSDVCQIATLVDRCLGDAPLAARLWKRFDERLSKGVVEIDAALADDNRADALARVHSLKGEAASLAAIRLQQAAIELENCLKSERQDADVHIARAAIALRTAAEQCRECVPLILDALANLTTTAESP